MLDDATNFEAENLRHTRANQIGDNDETGVIKTAHEEAHGRQPRYGLRPPRPLLPASVEKLKPAMAERMHTSVVDDPVGGPLRRTGQRAPDRVMR